MTTEPINDNNDDYLELCITIENYEYGYDAVVGDNDNDDDDGVQSRNQTG